MRPNKRFMGHILTHLMDKTLTQEEFILVMVLNYFRHMMSCPHPTNAVLAQQTGWSKRNVSRIMSGLTRKGIAEKETDGTNVIVHLDRSWDWTFDWSKTGEPLDKYCTP